MYQSAVSLTPTVAFKINLPDVQDEAPVPIGAVGFANTFTVIEVALDVQFVVGSFAVTVYNVVAVGVTVVVELSAK